MSTHSAVLNVFKPWEVYGLGPIAANGIDTLLSID